MINRCFAFKHEFESIDLVHVLPEKGIFRILVYLRFVLDEFGTTCITKSAKSLVIVVVSRRNCSYHDCLSVTT